MAEDKESPTEIIHLSSYEKLRVEFDEKSDISYVAVHYSRSEHSSEKPVEKWKLSPELLEDLERAKELHKLLLNAGRLKSQFPVESYKSRDELVALASEYASAVADVVKHLDWSVQVRNILVGTLSFEEFYLHQAQAVIPDYMQLFVRPHQTGFLTAMTSTSSDKFVRQVVWKKLKSNLSGYWLERYFSTEDDNYKILQTIIRASGLRHSLSSCIREISKLR